MVASDYGLDGQISISNDESGNVPSVVLVAGLKATEACS
jgi:hypothetical protein